MVRCIRSFLLLLLIFSCTAYAQKQGNIWYFGEKAGIDFNSGSPVVLLNGQLSTDEGCATICDANGQLLFYTEGSTIWNKNGNIMPNGQSLTGLPGATNTFSTSQASIIVPTPGKKDMYYVFSLTSSSGWTAYPGRLYYSMVDMSLNGGLGDVVAGQRGMLIDTGLVENLAAVTHANGAFVWILAHDKSNRYITHLIDATQVGGRIVSAVGQAPNSAFAQGCMAISPDGKKVARGMFLVGFELADFNNVTGLVSNPVFFNTGVNDRPYGVAFSANGKLLYGLEATKGNIYQWNLLAGSPAAIGTSATIIGKAVGMASSASQGGSIQLGPDKKIYVTQYKVPYLSVVNAPGVLGTGCNFQLNAVNLQGRNSVFGLPVYMQRIYDPIVIHYKDTCMGTATIFSITPKEINADSLRWYFGDPTSSTQNTATGDSVTHKFAGDGVFTIMCIKYSFGYADTTWATVSIDPKLVPVVDIGSDSIMCAESFILRSKNDYSSATYLWSTGDTAQRITISKKGTYWLRVIQNGCVAADTINITINPPPALELGNDTSLCPGDTVLLSSSILEPETNIYTWSNGSTRHTIRISSPGTYRLTITDSNACSVTDSIAIHSIVAPVIELGPDQILCNDEVLQLNTGDMLSVWSNGETATNITIANPGTYWAYPVHRCAVVTDTVHVSFEACEFFFPSGFTPNDDGKNDIARARGSLTRFSDYSLRIYNRLGQCVFYTTDIYAGWDGTFNGAKQEIGVYFYTIDYTYVSSLRQYTVRGDLTLIR